MERQSGMRASTGGRGGAGPVMGGKRVTVLEKTRRATPSSQKGQALVELLVAIGVSVVMLPAILMGLIASREGRVQ